MHKIDPTKGTPEKHRKLTIICAVPSANLMGGAEMYRDTVKPIFYRDDFLKPI
jgi:hypothetical protein